MEKATGSALLQVQLISADEAAAALASDRLLAVLGFGERPPDLPQTSPDPRVGWVPLSELSAPSPTYEAWFGATTVTASVFQDVVLSHNGAVAFGQLRIDEAEGGLEAATVAAYERILASTQALGYPHLLRIWHVIAGINGTSGDLDRYKVFCRGRHAVLAPL
ncbi:MAG TPA: hypothetical protein VES39_03215, partial [Rhodospirillales bacterium]|nr:hypothetical protein [Rhodospirillales bacterium]